MKTADYRLIAADIDGTLLNSKGELTERTIAAVRAAVSKGVYFVLSTGRPFQGIKNLVGHLGLKKMPYILFNGAIVMIGGSVVSSLDLDQADALAIVREGHARNSTMICWSQNRLYSEFIDEKITFYKSISGVEPIVVSSLSDVVENGITKFVWYDGVEKTKENFKQLKMKFGKTVNVAPSRVDFLEFYNKNCTKSTALRIICDELNIKRENCVAIRDGFNDLPMLEFAGLSVASGNADIEVKSRCDIVTASCDDDGVAKIIEEFIL